MPRNARRNNAQGSTAARLALAASALAWAAPPAAALDVLPDERATRQACERRFCEIVLDKKPSGPPLVCDMTKTWDRTKIKKSGEKKAISWGFGDARCNVALKLDRALLVPALTAPKHTVFVPPQTVACKIENAERKLTDLSVRASPKIKFKDGKAYKVWINVEDVSGDSDMKSLVWTVAKLADGLGIFHSATVKEINKFMYETCAAEYGDNGKGASKAKAKAAEKPAIKADAR